MIGVSFSWLTTAVFVGLAGACLIGVVLGWSLAVRNRGPKNRPDVAADLEKHNEALRLEVEALRASEERSKVLEKTLPDVKRRLEQYSLLESKVGAFRDKAAKADVLSAQVIDLRAQVVDLTDELGKQRNAAPATVVETPDAQRLAKLESNLVTLKAENDRLKQAASGKTAAAPVPAGGGSGVAATTAGTAAGQPSQTTPVPNQKSWPPKPQLGVKAPQSQPNEQVLGAGVSATNRAETDRANRTNDRVTLETVKRAGTPWHKGVTSIGTPGADHADDLKAIKGIGPVLEKTLNGLGITTWEQIANFESADIERVAEAISTFPGRIQRDDWVGGAKELIALGHPDSDKLAEIRKRNSIKTS